MGGRETRKSLDGLETTRVLAWFAMGLAIYMQSCRI